MLLLPTLILLLTQFQLLFAQTDSNGITLLEKIEAMERQILNPFTLNSVVTPCSVNFNDNPNRGEQTSAEWVRIVFHDMITANIAGPGLGGLDASIGFESDRAENLGIFVNVTLGQFSQFSSVFMSMSDMIALGLSDSLATCDPSARRILLKVGRMDATGPGPVGVPGPTDTLAFAQAAFAKAGFSQSEMIQAVACGHSLGGVHRPNFPAIAPELNDPTNLESRASFDSSPAVFDNVVVNEYLTGTGKKGGPLVIGPAATNSDLRIYKSDSNVTISAMNSASSFQNTCFTIFTKMINTVPSGTILSAPLGPRPWLLRESHLDLNPTTGAVTFSGVVIGHGTGSLPNVASYMYNTEGGGNTGPKVTAVGTTYPLVQGVNIGFGAIRDYPFSEPLNSPTILSITIQNNYTAPINQNIFILPSQSFHNQIMDPTGGFTVNQQYVVRAAIKATLAPAGTVLTAKMWYPTSQHGTVVPKIVSLTATMTLKGTLGIYKIYQVVIITGDGVTPIPGGNPVIQVSLGTTQISAKVEPIGTNWPSCSNSPLLTC